MKKYNNKELREKLTDLQYEVTQRKGTEPPFENPYWNQKEPGIYVDVISGKPLFLSSDKFISKSGWPSFVRSIPSSIKETKDTSYGMIRTEVKSASSGAHLGHLFEGDGPEGQPRYCINSASLRFIPKDKMKEEGYGKYIDQI